MGWRIGTLLNFTFKLLTPLLTKITMTTRDSSRVVNNAINYKADAVLFLDVCKPKIVRKIEQLEQHGTLKNTDIVELFGKKYNHYLIDKYGAKGYIQIIDEITRLQGGRIFMSWIVKKSWMSEAYKMKVYEEQI